MISSEPSAFVEFLAVAVDDDGVRIARRQPAERVIDQPKPAHHVLDIFVIATAKADVLLDGVGARRQHDHAVRVPAVADLEDLAQGRMFTSGYSAMCASSVMRAPSKKMTLPGASCRAASR